MKRLAKYVAKLVKEKNDSTKLNKKEFYEKIEYYFPSSIHISYTQYPTMAKNGLVRINAPNRFLPSIKGLTKTYRRAKDGQG